MKVTGENVVVYFDILGEWTPYACAQNATISRTTEYIEISVSGNGSYMTVLPTKNSWTASIDGIVAIEETGSLTLADLVAKQFNHERVLLKYQRIDDATNLWIESGYAYITASSDTGNFGGMNTFSMEFQGTGELASTFDPDVIAGHYRVGTSLAPLICFLAPTVLYSDDALAPGVIMYVDSALSVPLTGKNYIVSVDGGDIYNIDNATGEVGTSTGQNCDES